MPKKFRKEVDQVSKPVTPESRKTGKQMEREIEYDIKYLRKVLGPVNENIPVPEALQGYALRQKLAQEPLPATESLWASAADFLRSRVFSMQSVVSYALAFVVIMAITYTVGQNPASLVDGNIAVTGAMAVNQAEPVEAEEEAITEESPAVSFSAGNVTADTGAAMPDIASATQTAPNAAVSPSTGGQAAAMGQGGSGAVTVLGEDDAYSYLARQNDVTDPHRDSALLTLEMVSKDSGQLMAAADLPGAVEITEFFCQPRIMGFVALMSDGSVMTQIYETGVLEDEPGREVARPVFLLEQPGVFEQGRVAEDILHVVTKMPAGVAISASQRLPESVSDTAYVITALDMTTRESNQVVYVGADDDKPISVHSRSIYISYAVLPEEQEEGVAPEPELYMAQIKLEGTDFEMVLVPDIE